MKVTLYNHRYAFSETILPPDDPDEYDLEIQAMWEQSEEIDCAVGDVPKTHLAYGWLEAYAQSSLAVDVDFTHIKVEK